MPFSTSRTIRTVRVAIALVIAATSLAVVDRPAQAVVKETAFVVRVADGDTFDVDVNGDGAIDARVRMIGIDAPEKGDCGYWWARRKLTRLIEGREVTLATDVADATGFKNRWLRRVMVVRDGRRIDATAYLLRRGLGFWMSDDVQTSKMVWYRKVASVAAAKDRGIFRGDRCKDGPAAGARLRLDLQWKADTNDGEHIRITNRGPGKVDFDNWRIRSGGIRVYTIPSGRAIPAGRTLKVYVGKGNNRRYVRYLGNGSHMFPDIEVMDPASGHVGDGAYLLDPQGDVRAWQIYPCVRKCWTHAAGRIAVSRVNYDPPGKDNDDLNGEWFKVKNVSDRRVHVGRVVLDAKPYTVELPPKLRLWPGEELIVRTGSGKRSRLEYFLNSWYPVHHNDGDVVLVRTYHGVIIDCHAWGNESCS